ncbi:hypothetical protein M0R72_13920 [Candidatus Pacearchaeota archaeon]|jgi:hypothetical protein|nr:hypothetical protein [Candidatus Pacearchaeota archaeon]
MNVTIEFKGFKELIASMSAAEKKQLPYAIKEALNKTAEQVKTEEIKVMRQTLDRPTPYAQNSLYIDYANKTKLTATVYFKDKNSTGKRGTPAANFIEPQVSGGKRNLKRFESALRKTGILPIGMYIAPGKRCQLDAYGNIPKGFIVMILAYFQSYEVGGLRTNTTAKRKASLKAGSKRKGVRGYEYFVSYGKGRMTGRGRNTPQHLAPGIYRKQYFGVQTGGGGSFRGSSLEPMLMFVKEPLYQKRFPFKETAEKIINRNLDDNFYRAFDHAMATAK